MQVLAQSNTFILAGYETTSNALAYTIYCIAGNLEAEAELLKEIDKLDPDTPLRSESLDQASSTPGRSSVSVQTLDCNKSLNLQLLKQSKL